MNVTIESLKGKTELFFDLEQLLVVALPVKILKKQWNIFGN